MVGEPLILIPETPAFPMRAFALFGGESLARQNINSAASITLMSMPPEPPKRLADILSEILALSNSPRTNHSEPVGSPNPSESDAQCADDQSHFKVREDKKPPTR